MAAFRALWLQYPLLPSVALVLMACCVYLYFHGTNKRLDRFMVAVTLAVPAHILVTLGADQVAQVRPAKFDLYIYWFDKWIGFEPGFAMSRVVVSHLPLIVVLAVTYQLLPLAIVAIYGAYLWRRSDREAVSLAAVFILNLALGVPLYFLFPVCGPAYAFSGFPAEPAGPIVPHPILLNAPPNGMPSIHFSTALLILWYSRKLPYGRWIGAAYLLLTAASTLSSGEHYILDLAAAVPYAIAVHALGTRLAAALPRPSRPVLKCG
jgi:hypothetical protein